jgi:molybdopterin converting factor small subunit
MGIFDRWRGESLRIHIIIRGRIGNEWRDVDTHLRVPEGTTLDKLIEAAEGANIPLRHALEHSPHLRDTMMLNGERCPLEENRDRPLANGDELYLLAPLAGG